MIKKYAFDRKLGVNIGVIYCDEIWRDGYRVNLYADDLDYEIREVTIPDEKVLDCYSFFVDRNMYYGETSQYEIRKKGRYHAIVVNDLGVPQLALLCKMGCDGETGHVFVFWNPFDDVTDRPDEYYRPAAYLENDNDDDNSCDGTFLAWVIFDECFM